ncbi:Peptide chain release factor [Dillenia turbinata]|uniref:Peptide chain release factor n=1 Tax=Dillenia turbinata TaxID=194707 RepID=A0AAN8ZPD7_9MAGN
MAATNRICNSIASFVSKWQPSTSNRSPENRFLCFAIRASQSTDDKNKVYKELGLVSSRMRKSLHVLLLDALILKVLACKSAGFFSLKKKIEDAIVRAENTAPAALELEEARRIKQEELMREYDLWNDPAKSNEILADLAGSVKVVDALKDLRYKAEEAKLITQLADMDAINFGLLKQAYKASVDVSKFLDQYEMSKLLKGPYDMDGACVIIKARSEGIYPEMWAEQLLNMYTKWAEKQGNQGRVVEKHCSGNGIKYATVEFEFQYAFGYLSGEQGIHRMINSQDVSIFQKGCLASVDVIPMLLETAPDVDIDEKDLLVSYKEEEGNTPRAIFVQHIPTGITTSSSGERSQFANKMKALNRLKAKLLVIARGQGVSNIKNISIDNMVNTWNQETRKYVFHPFKLVQDVKTGIQVPDLNSILDGNIEPFIVAHINIRQANDTLKLDRKLNNSNCPLNPR